MYDKKTTIGTCRTMILMCGLPPRTYVFGTVWRRFSCHRKKTFFVAAENETQINLRLLCLEVLHFVAMPRTLYFIQTC